MPFIFATTYLSYSYFNGPIFWWSLLNSISKYMLMWSLLNRSDYINIIINTLYFTITWLLSLWLINGTATSFKYFCRKRFWKITSRKLDQCFSTFWASSPGWRLSFTWQSWSNFFVQLLSLLSQQYVFLRIFFYCQNNKEI